MQIFKYDISGASRLGFVSVLIPHPFEILKAGFQKGRLCVWARVHPPGPKSHIEFSLVPTGSEIQEGEKYIDTVFLNDGELVYHIHYKHRLPEGAKPI